MLTLLIAGAALLAMSKLKFSPSTSTVNPVSVTGTNAVPLGPPQPNDPSIPGVGPQTPRNWPPTAGQPGFVTIGGKAAPTSYHGGDIDAAIKVTSLGIVGVGAVSGVAQGITAITGNAILPSLGAALPIVGAGLAVVGIVLGIIARHHSEAVAREAQTLDQALPVIRQRQVLIAQAAILGEINYAQATALVQQCIADFYKMVAGVQKGTWHWDPKYNDSSAGFTVGRHSNTWGMDQQSPNAHAPGTCNSACWYGHFTVEGDCYTILLPTIQKILAGQHGVMVLPICPNNQTIVGVAEVDMIF